jgi:hypothetical protein
MNFNSGTSFEYFSNNHDLREGHIENCQICGSSKIEPIIDLGYHAPCDSLLWPKDLLKSEKTYPLRLVRCMDCSLVQIDYVVNPEELFFAEYPYRSGITQTLVENLMQTGSTVVNRFNIGKDKLAVDIGSNDGTLLQGFKDLGMNVVGVEPTNIADIAVQNGINTIKAFFDDKVADRILREYGSAEVITASNMFAHVAKLGSLIRGVEKLLSEDGIFVTESHYLVDLLDSVQYDSIYHEHLKYYSIGSLEKLFSYYNLTIVDVDRIANYGGSIRVYARKGNKNEISENVHRLKISENEVGLHLDTTYKKFSGKIRESKLALQSLIVNAKREGKQVVGIGCPGRAATLLNYCGVDKENVDYIAEQTECLKIGLYVPGCHLPVVNEKKMLDDQPDYAIMLSWHYWRPIVEKLRARGLRSKIVIPLPELRVIE